MSETLISTGQLGLGYRKSDENHALLAANSQPLVLYVAPVTTPQTCDPRAVVMLLCQFAMGSCTGHAMSHLGQWLNWLKTRQQVLISRMWCYLRAQHHSGFEGSDQGASIAGAVEAARQDGLPREETFPYPNPVHYSTAIPPVAFTEARDHLLRSSSVLKSYADAQLWLGNGLGGIDIGIDWVQGLANFRGETIELQHLSGYTLGGHSLALIALSTRVDEHGRNYVWLANSHGPQWGQGGWAEVAPAVIEHWIQSGAAFIGVSDMEQYAPRAIPVAWMV
jgi:hypothetical protein